MANRVLYLDDLYDAMKDKRYVLLCQPRYCRDIRVQIDSIKPDAIMGEIWHRINLTTKEDSNFEHSTCVYFEDNRIHFERYPR